MKKLLFVSLVLALACLPLSCSWLNNESARASKETKIAEDAEPPQGPSTPLKPPQVGDTVIDFALNDLAGKTVKTAEARKDKVVVLKFGATWPPACTMQIPHFNEVVKTYADNVVVLAVNVREPADRVKTHAEKHGVKYTTLLDLSGAVTRMYGVKNIPTVLVAGKDGKVAYRGYYSPFKVLKAKIDPLLK